MYGVIDGLYRCSDKRVEDLNTRIYRRNVPSGKLQPLFDPRSVPTRYTTMPIIDSKTKANTFIEKLPIYSPHKTFNPGYRGPISGYKIDQDSRLRNIFFPLQNAPHFFFAKKNSSVSGLSIIPIKGLEFLSKASEIVYSGLPFM